MKIKLPLLKKKSASNTYGDNKLVRKPRVKRKVKALLESLGTIVALSVIAAILISILFLAFPKTELVSSLTRYDLKVKNTDWKNIYRISTTEQDTTKLENLRNVLATRLEKYGVEQFTISQPIDQGDSTKLIQIDIQSSKDAFIINQLLTDTGEISFMEPKADVDFTATTPADTTVTDPSNTTTYDPKTDLNNYTPTEFTRNFFRNIEVTKTTLQDTTGNKQDTYIGTFKTWVADKKKFSDFINNHLGKAIGIKVNGQVGSRTISTNDVTLFFIQLGTTEQEAQYYDIVFNSGVIESTFTVLPEQNSTPTSYAIDYEKAALAAIVGALLATVYIVIRKKSLQKGVHFILSTGLVLSIYIGYYKLSLDPILLYFISFAGLYTVIMNLLIAFNFDNIRYIVIGNAVVLVVVNLLSLGNTAWLARDLFLINLAIVPVNYLSKLYMNKLTKALLK